jgi:endonuclease/exonuclease/phosphatase family metal-dependent hydrolase
LAQCVSQSCRAPAESAGPECLQCLVSNTLADAPLAGCLEDERRPTRDEVPRGGIALLSRLPLTDRGERRLEAPLLDRLILHARLPDTPIGEVHAFCTHLTTPLPLDLPGMSPEVNRRQVAALIDYVNDETKGSSGITIILGDLNTGPALGKDIDGYQASHYALLRKAGLSDPFADGPAPKCTRCNDNLLVGGGDRRGVLIDHVLVRGYSGTMTAERMFDEPVTLTIGGRKQRYPLSDHYGVRVVLGKGGPRKDVSEQ